MDLRFVKPVPKRQFPFRAVVAVSMALPLVASIALVRSEALHSWTAALLESAPAVQHRKAVIAAREKRFDESFSLFEQALAGGGAATIWVDYAGALSSAGRSADVLRLWPRMPASARSHQKVLVAVVDALAATGNQGSVPEVMARILDGVDAKEAHRFRQALAAGKYGSALRDAREALHARPELALWAERYLGEALRAIAVRRARSGEPDAALTLLDDLAAAITSPPPELVADRLVARCWAHRSGEAIASFLASPPGLELPEYAVTALVRAWRDDDHMASLPEDTLSRLLAKTFAYPEAASQLIAGTRSARQLTRARTGLPALALPPAAAERLGREIDHQLAVRLAQLGQHDEAARLLVGLMERDPDDLTVRADLVTVLSWAGRHAEAVHWAGLSSGPSALPEYAQAALQRSRADLESLRAVLEQRRAALRGQAVELAQAGKLDAAARLIDKVGSGGAAGAAARRALVLAYLGRHLEAVGAYEALPRSAPRSIRLLEAVAGSYRARGQIERALALWREILEREPRHRPALDATFTILFESGRLGEAETLLEDVERRGAAVELFRARLAHHEAVELARSGDYEKALADLDRAAHQLDVASDARGGASSRPRRPRRRPAPRRGRPHRRGRRTVVGRLVRLGAALAAALALGHAPRARAGAPDEAPGQRPPAEDGESAEADLLRAAVDWDRVAVLSWAGKHWEAVEAFEALPEPEAAPQYVKHEAAEAYRATHRPGAALALYAELLAADPRETRALQRLRSLLLDESARFLEPGLSRLAKGGAVPPSWLDARAWADRQRALAVDTARKGDLVGARGAMRASLQAPDADRAQLRDWVVLLYLSRRFAEVVALSRVVPEHDRSLEPLVSAAQAATGHLEEALSVARRWHEQRPKEPGASAEVVHRLLALGKQDEASAFIARLPAKDAARLAADVLLHRGRPAEAAAAYEARLASEPGDAEALLGLAMALEVQRRERDDAKARAADALKRLSVEEYVLHRSVPAAAALAMGRLLNELRRPDDTLAVLGPLLAADPDQREAVWLLGQAHELRQEHIEAADAYGRILRSAPGDARAAEARARVLLRLAAVTPASVELSARKEPSRGFDRLAIQTRAAREWALLGPDSASSQAPAAGAAHGLEAALVRARFIEGRSHAILDALARMTSRGAALEEPMLRIAAEAHIDLNEPGRALDDYRSLQARLEERGADREAVREAILGQVRCLTLMTRFEEAGRLLDAMDAETSAYVASRPGGPRQPNWDKADLLAERGAWLLAQDRLADAEAHFANMVRRAPQSAEGRCGLADTYRLRGWPLRARREFMEASTLHPDDVDIRVGLAEALNASGDVARSEEIASELAEAYPYNRHVRELALKLDAARSWQVTSQSEASASGGVADGVETRLALRKRVGQLSALGLVTTWKQEREGGSVVRHTRTTLTGQVNPRPEITLGAAFSAEPWDQRRGAAAEVHYVPTDQLSFELRGDTDTWTLPPAAFANGVSGWDVEARADYRRDETLSVESQARLLALSGGNRILEGTIRGALQVLATGRWRALAGVEACAEGARLTQDEYFAPARSWCALLAPALEHAWRPLRSYQLLDRVKVEAGVDLQSGLGLGRRWMLQYDQRHRFGERAELQLEAGVSQQRYGGPQELSWRLGLAGNIHL